MIKLNSSNEQRIFVTSDTHYGHKNICRGVSTWDSGTRDFETLEEMNNEIVSNINKYVRKDDILIHMGDWSFGGLQNIGIFRKLINCNNIYLCFGNHDTHIKSNKLFDVKQHIFTQDLFTNCNDVFYFKIRIKDNSKHINFFCSHYAHRVWDKSHHGVMHLYGHSHNNLENFPNGRSMDVGIDSAFSMFEEYRPFKIEEVYNILKERSVAFLDHHNENTN